MANYMLMATFTAQYRKWKEDPMTQMVSDILREEGRPQSIPMAKDVDLGHVALSIHGETVGWNGCLDRLLNLDYIPETQADLAATYGAVRNETKKEE